MILRLTDEERASAVRLARSYQRYWGSVPNRKLVSTQTANVNLRLQGFIGEVLFARVTGQPVREIYEPTGDGGYDQRLPDGRTVQIKVSGVPYGGLLFGVPQILREPGKQYVRAATFDADVAVLFAPTEDPRTVPCHEQSVFKLAGWVDRNTYGRLAQARDFGYGLTLCLESSHLQTIETLLDGTQRPQEEPTATAGPETSQRPVGRICKAHRASWCPKHTTDGRRLPIIQCRMGEDGHTVHCVECFRIERIPPQYRGKTWPHATSQDVVQIEAPPIRNDPSTLTDEFVEFRAQAVKVGPIQHPEWYCRRCKGFLVGVGQTVCLQCRTKAGEVPRYRGKQ